MNALLPLLYVALCIVLIIRLPFFRSLNVPQWSLVSVFALKVAAALALHTIYTYYYTDRTTADVFKYFDDAQVLFATLYENPSHFFQILFLPNPENLPHLQAYFSDTWHWIRPTEMGLFNDNQTIIRINMILMLFSWGNIFVHHILAAFISLVAFCLLYNVFIAYFPQQKLIVFLGIFCVPSSLFWASAMLKECVVMLGLGLFLYGLHSLLQQFRRRALILFVCGIFVLLHIKIYILAALIPASAAFFVCAQFPNLRAWKVYGGMYALCILFLLVNYVLHGIPLFDSLAHKREISIMQTIEVQAGSALSLSYINGSIWDFAKETPAALWRAVALPYLWNIHSIMDVLPAMESFIIFVLILLVCLFPRKTNAAQQNLLLFSFVFSIALLWFTGITSATVGSIVRYRMPMLPFVFTALALCVEWRKLFTKYRLYR
ncbi:MAG: hypothetical protein LBU90_01325 [Bacteroidales bacterium]|jgi:hypothetical protein|nr:hypothetical protein [Bacteroidales bacterium]